MQILNYTGKYITVINEFGSFITYPPEAHAHCDVQIKKKMTVDLMTVYKKDYGRVVGLPCKDPNLEKLYIVTPDVAEASRPRKDLLLAEGPHNVRGGSCYNLVNVN